MRKAHLRGRGPHFPILDRIVQYDFEPGYVVFTMPAPKRLRVKVGDTTIADTARGLILQESDHLPVYYFPVDDVAMELMEKSATVSHCPFKGDASHYTLRLGDRTVEDIMWRYEAPIEACPPIAGHVGFYWHRVDHWLEEDEEIFVHARDPFRRVDCLPSSRRVEVFLEGEKIAESTDSVFLFETGLPTRYYLPPDAVKEGVLEPSDTVSQCPYKGTAGYHHVVAGGKRHEDICWYYADPVEESRRIKGLVCFANEFVDRILVDGVEQPRPQTSFSHGYN